MCTIPRLERRLLAAALAAIALSGCRRDQQPPSSTTTAATQAAVPPAVHVTQRPPVMGRNAGVSAGHPLTTAAAFEVLPKGGNAFDAGVAAMLVGGVVEQDLVQPRRRRRWCSSIRAKDRKVTSVVGQGWAPKGATSIGIVAQGKTLAGAGLDPAVVPGALHAALTVLERWGTMSFEQVSRPRDRIRRAGLSAAAAHGRAIDAKDTRKFIEAWPDNKAIWLKPDGSSYKAGETIKLPTLARTLKRMVEAERAAAGQGRAAGIVAARDRFYKGDIAREMVAFLRSTTRRSSWTTSPSSSRGSRSRRTPPTAATRLQAGFGSQGPVLLQTLNILEKFDLKAMGTTAPTTCTRSSRR